MTTIKKPFTVALVQIQSAGEDIASNIAHAHTMVEKAVSEKKEIWNSPYATGAFPKYAETIAFKSGERYDATKSPSPSIQAIAELAVKYKVWIFGGSIPEKDGDKVYNSGPVINPEGELVALHRKVHLFDIDVPGGQRFKESDTLTAGGHMTLVDTPFGLIGEAICYDIRFPELATIAARNGAGIMIYPGAFNMTTGPLHWDLLQRARALDNQMYVITCSPARVTTGDGYKSWGHSGVVDPMGRIVQQLDEKESILYVDIDPNVLSTTRQAIPIYNQRRFDIYPDVAK